MGEASTIVHGLQGLRVDYETRQAIDWKLTEPGEGSGFLISRGDNLVASIVIGDLDSDLHLDQVVAAYGEPAYVQAHDCREGKCITALIYPDMGMLLEVFVKDHGQDEAHQVKILPDTIVDRSLFFSAGLDNFKKMPEYQGSPLWQWKGYGDYP